MLRTLCTDRTEVLCVTLTLLLLIDGVLHQGSKMIPGGTGKSNKSWCLLDLAVSVASGQKWRGRQCARCSVLIREGKAEGSLLAAQPEKLLSARDRIGHGVLPVDDDGAPRISGPER